jgi:hypothetical protein
LFRTHLILKGSGWYFLAPPSFSDGSTDTSHANREPMWVVFAYEAGIGFSLSDVDRMANTLTDNIWNGSTSEPKFTNYMDGSNGDYGTRSAWGNGNIYSGWVLTGKYSAKAQTAGVATLDAIRAGVSIPASNYTMYGKIALSGHRLRNCMK